jgi:cellobiose phosphorylase
MIYGHFDDGQREYVITRPDTPLPWVNYLGCETPRHHLQHRRRLPSSGTHVALTRYRFQTFRPGAPALHSRRWRRIVRAGAFCRAWRRPSAAGYLRAPSRAGLHHHPLHDGRPGTDPLLRAIGRDRPRSGADLTNQRAQRPVRSLAVEFCWTHWTTSPTSSAPSIGQVDVDDGVISQDRYRSAAIIAYFACSALAGFDTQRQPLGRIGLGVPAAVSPPALDSIAYGWRPSAPRAAELTPANSGRSSSFWGTWN